MNGLASLGHIAQQPHKNTHRRFIHFSQNTDGRYGRPVYIDAQLLPDFLAAVDISSFGGIEVVKMIEQLRALAGGIHSHQNKDIASLHKTLVNRVEVHYYITQATSERKGGVYITKLKSINTGVDKPGLYRYSNGAFAPTNDADVFSLEQACIGASSSLKTLEDKTKNYISESSWGNIEYDLFFTPNYDVDQYGIWLTPSQKRFNEAKSAVQLAKILQETQKFLLHTTDKLIKIRVFDSSSKVLDQSLTLVNGHIDKLGFEFIDPDQSVTSAISQLTSKNAKLSKFPVKITSRSALISLSIVKNKLATALRDAERPHSAKELRDKTQVANTALTIGGALSQQKGNFITAARQADLLGKWHS